MNDTPTPEEPLATVFRFERRELEGNKQAQLLCRSDLLVAAVQTVGEGGETNLHKHKNLDGFWFVLRGRVRFYTTDDEVVAELGPYEGILVPRGYPYWFESASDEELEILQVEASAARLRSMQDVMVDRVDISLSDEVMERRSKVKLFGAEM